MARRLAPDTSGGAGAAVPRDGVTYLLPGPMLIDLRTREISVDLRESESRERISLGRTPNDRVKRVVDIVAVAAAAPLWLPLLGVLAFAVKSTSRGPMFETQERLGRGGRAFRCVKLRTRAVGADVTPRFGRVLRRTGLEDLPQLLAVLRGRMSLVGPRPIAAREARYYGPYLRLMQTVRPGMTGLWQVSGRNDGSYQARVAYDVQYVLTRTLWSDVKLIVKTALLMFRPGHSVSSPG